MVAVKDVSIGMELYFKPKDPVRKEWRHHKVQVVEINKYRLKVMIVTAPEGVRLHKPGSLADIEPEHLYKKIESNEEALSLLNKD